MRKILGLPFIRMGAWIVSGVVASLVVFNFFGVDLFSSGPFAPHATCYLQNPKMIWLHVCSDLAIGLAYVSISSTLAFLVYRASRDIPFHWMFLAFGLFIVSCGFTHFMEVLTVWQPFYWLAGYVKVITAAASVTTALALFPLVPKIFSLINEVKISELRKQRMEAANAELAAFASSVSHDLRAPLRAMHGIAVALREEYAASLDPTARQYTDRILAASHRMDTLIRDLLEHTRLTHLVHKLERVKILDCIAEARLALAADIREKNARIEEAGEFPEVCANSTLLLQVLVNLLGNAIKFTRPGMAPHILIAGHKRDDVLRVTITDNGIGIATEFHERIFNVFERLHTSDEYPGTGIGLAIVKKAIEQMDGKIGVDSKPGEGSSFWFELKLA